jgi:hypothetical protein
VHHSDLAAEEAGGHGQRDGVALPPGLQRLSSASPAAHGSSCSSASETDPAAEVAAEGPEVTAAGVLTVPGPPPPQTAMCHWPVTRFCFAVLLSMSFDQRVDGLVLNGVAMLLDCGPAAASQQERLQALEGRQLRLLAAIALVEFKLGLPLNGGHVASLGPGAATAPSASRASMADGGAAGRRRREGPVFSSPSVFLSECFPRRVGPVGIYEPPRRSTLDDLKRA